MAEIKHYFPEVDIVKGIAILLVILGHSFCVFPMDLYSEFPVFGDFVRSFQMPLFFIASGFLLSMNGPFSIFIKKKAKRLLVPLYAFAVLTVLLKYVFSSFTHGGEIDLLQSAYGILQGHYYWFLYVLMVIILLCRLIKKDSLLVIFSILSVILCLFTDIKSESFFSVGQIVYYFPFLVLGYYFRKIYSFINQKQTTVISITFAALIIYSTSMLTLYDDKIVKLYVATLTGSAFTWGVAVFLSKIGTMKVLRHFGHYSLQYYLNHLLVMLPIYYTVNATVTSPILQLLTIWCVAVMISWAMLQIEEKVKIFRLLSGLSA